MRMCDQILACGCVDQKESHRDEITAFMVPIRLMQSEARWLPATAPQVAHVSLVLSNLSHGRELPPSNWLCAVVTTCQLSSRQIPLSNCDLWLWWGGGRILCMRTSKAPRRFRGQSQLEPLWQNLVLRLRKRSVHAAAVDVVAVNCSMPAAAARP